MKIFRVIWIVVLSLTAACAPSASSLPQVHAIAVDIVQDGDHQVVFLVDYDSIPPEIEEVGCSLVPFASSQVSERLQIIFSTCGTPNGQEFGVILVGGDEKVTQLALLAVNDHGESVPGRQAIVQTLDGSQSWTISSSDELPLELEIPVDQLVLIEPDECDFYTQGDVIVFTCGGNYILKENA